MQNLPEHGQRVRVWPFPGRQAQLDERPVDAMGAGRFIPKAGAVVEWSPFHHSQLIGGAIIMHAPPCDKHAHAEDGKGECHHCGRDPKAAQEYDANRANGMAAAKAAASSLPKHPRELGLHPQSDAMKAHREVEAKAQAKAEADAKEKAAEQSAAEAAADAEARAKAEADAEASKAEAAKLAAEKHPDPIK